MKKREERNKTKLKLFAAIMMTLLLTGTAFIGVPTRALEPIKIGVYGPEAWIQGKGMKEGAELAKEKINAAGGILGHPVEIVFADDLRGKPDPDAETGRAAALELMAAEVDFVLGGFRTESAIPAREVFMDNDKIYFVAGAATNELIDVGGPNKYGDVRTNYARYKYTFRVTPINNTMLFKSIAYFFALSVVPRLLRIYKPPPLKVAVISENLIWADVMHLYLTSDLFWASIVGPGRVDVIETACSRVSPTAEDLYGPLSKVKASGAQLLIPVLSGPVGRAFITQWKDMGIKAIPLGVNVPGQEIPTHWEATLGKCLYEGFLATAGQRTPITTSLVEFYDRTMTVYGHAPIYTSYGVYDGIIAIDEMIEAAGRWPMTSDEMVPLIEKTYRPHAITGKFKYTGPNPGNKWPVSNFTDYDPDTPGDQPYPYLAENPTMMGTLHDTFLTPVELTDKWYTGFLRALFTQWQAGRLEVVFPVDQAYSKIWALPSWMYPYATDVNQDALRTITDIAIVSYAIGTSPGDGRWQFVADYTGNRFIDGDDLTPVAFDYGKPVTPLPPP